MPSLRARADNGHLYVDFRYRGVRCREPLPYIDIPGERRRAETFLAHLKQAIAQGEFRYGDFFPSSRRAVRHGWMAAVGGQATFGAFAPVWIADMTPQWSSSHLRTVRIIIAKHLLPVFGGDRLTDITRTQILAFRAKLAQCPGYRGTLTPARINKVMCLLRQLLKEAAVRFDFPQPFREIRPLRMKRSDVHPFSIEEAHALVNAIDPHYRNYLLTRFFTGLRSGEINGLRWIHVDFERNLILVRETLVAGGLEEGAKTERSERDVPLLPLVREALQAQWRAHDPTCPWVFSTPSGFPIDAKNFNNRVWIPLLARLGLARRRPYQTRHTAATLMLAAGESPEWVAHVLGHTSLQMLFRVYSRFVPNLTRQDGSAIAQVLDRRWSGGGDSEGEGVVCLTG